LKGEQAEEVGPEGVRVAGGKLAESSGKDCGLEIEQVEFG